MAGSIRRRGKRAWQLTVWIGRDPKTGKPRRRYATVAGTKKDAERALTAMLRERDLGIDVNPERITVAQHLTVWLRDYAAVNVAPSSYRRYRQICDRLNDLIGELRLRDLRPNHIKTAYARLLQDNLKPKTVVMHHRVLRQALKDAVRWQLLGTNPADAVDPPKAERTEMRALDSEAVDQLLAACDDPALEMLLYVAVGTGLRQGELLGLKWADCDLDARQAHIQRALQYQPGEGDVFRSPKSAHSRRNIALSTETVRALRDHRTRQLEHRLQAGAAYADQDLVFPDVDGSPLSPTKIWKRFPKLVKAAGVGPLRFHDLRHTAATLMFKAGIHQRIVADRLGHASTSLTMDVYSHVTPDMQREAAEAMDAILKPPRKRNG